MALSTFRIGHDGPDGKAIYLAPVRFLPRGVSAAKRKEFFDVWFPLLAPSAETLKAGQKASAAPDDAKAWKRFADRYTKEMSAVAQSEAIRLLARVAAKTDLRIGCYCQNEARCHRSLLRAMIDKAAD